MADPSTAILTGFAGVLSGLVKKKSDKIAKDAQAAKEKSQKIQDEALLHKMRSEDVANKLKHLQVITQQKRVESQNQKDQAAAEASRIQSQFFQRLLTPQQPQGQQPQGGGQPQPQAQAQPQAQSPFQLESFKAGAGTFVNPAVRGQVAAAQAGAKPLPGEAIRQRVLNASMIRQGDEAIKIISQNPQFAGPQAEATAGLRRQAGGRGIGRLYKAVLGAIGETQMTPQEATFRAAIRDIQDKAVFLRSGVAVREEERASEAEKMGIGAAPELFPILLRRYIKQAQLDSEFRVELQSTGRTGQALGGTAQKPDPLGLR